MTRWLWVLALPVIYSTSTEKLWWAVNASTSIAKEWSVMITTDAVMEIAIKKPGHCFVFTKETQGVISFADQYQKIEPIKKICVDFR